MRNKLISNILLTKNIPVLRCFAFSLNKTTKKILTFMMTPNFTSKSHGQLNHENRRQSIRVVSEMIESSNTVQNIRWF